MYCMMVTSILQFCLMASSIQLCTPTISFACKLYHMLEIRFLFTSTNFDICKTCRHTKIPGTNPPKSVPIWWKSSLTMMQMIQFVTMMTQATILIVGQCSTLNFRVTALYGVYIFSLLILFAQFFVQSYMKPKKKKA